MAIATDAALLPTTLLFASSTRTVTAGAMDAVASVLEGCWRKASLVAAPKTMRVPVAVGPVPVP